MDVAIEVTSSWGETDVLEVAHLWPPRDHEVLGEKVVVVRAGTVLVRVPEGAVCDETAFGHVDQRRLRGYVPLRAGATIVVRHGGLVHRVRVVPAESALGFGRLRGLGLFAAALAVVGLAYVAVAIGVLS